MKVFRKCIYILAFLLGRKVRLTVDGQNRKAPGPKTWGGRIGLLITDFCFDTSWFTARAVHVWASCPISCLHASHDAVTAHLGLVPFFSCAYAHGYSYPWPTMAIILQTERRQSLACSTTPGRQPRLPLPMNPAKGSVVSSFIVMLGLSPLTAGANLQRSCEP